MNPNRATTDLAELYQLLADTLAEPPAWMSTAGVQWPLYKLVSKAGYLAHNEMRQKVLAELADIPEETPDQRRRRYQLVFFGNRYPALPLYESLARDGRLITPTTFAVANAYRTAGLTVAGAECPDHAAVELAFLAYLAGLAAEDTAEASQWCKAYRLFIKRHAGQWLPALGDGLAGTGDPVYTPLGRLLAQVLRGEMQSPIHETAARKAHRLPIVPQPEICTLCGFCTQVCPTRALTIGETDGRTWLVITDSTCVGCQRCAQACPTRALTLDPIPQQPGPRLLRQSPRELCPACGQPTVSQAELKAIVAQIGDLEWLHYCFACRPLILEKLP